MTFVWGKFFLYFTVCILYHDFSWNYTLIYGSCSLPALAFLPDSNDFYILVLYWIKKHWNLLEDKEYLDIICLNFSDWWLMMLSFLRTTLSTDSRTSCVQQTWPWPVLLHWSPLYVSQDCWQFVYSCVKPIIGHSFSFWIWLACCVTWHICSFLPIPFGNLLTGTW